MPLCSQQSAAFPSSRGVASACARVTFIKKEREKKKKIKDSKSMGNSPAAEDTLSNVVSFSFFIIAQSAVCSLKGERSFARWRRSFSNLFFFQKFICSKESYCYSHIYPFFFVQFCNGIDGNLFFFFFMGI